MVQQTALGLIIAKALVFIDAIMECFVTASYSGNGEIGCNLPYCGSATVTYTGQLTECGQYVASQLTIAVIALSGLAANILPALGVGPSTWTP
jgi:hypothetical protein